MSERAAAARSLRESAERLRQIAAAGETKLSAELRRVAEDLIAEAKRLENSVREKPPNGAEA